jgi:hypothetical protein
MQTASSIPAGAVDSDGFFVLIEIGIGVLYFLWTASVWEQGRAVALLVWRLEDKGELHENEGGFVD